MNRDSDTETVNSIEELEDLVDAELARQARQIEAARRRGAGRACRDDLQVFADGGDAQKSAPPVLLGPGGDFLRGYAPRPWRWPGRLWGFLGRLWRRVFGPSCQAAPETTTDGQ